MLQRCDRKSGSIWIWGILGLLIFVCMMIFSTVTRGNTQDFTVLVFMVESMLITVYVLTMGWLLKCQFQIADSNVVQLISIFILAHFLPFLLDDADNVHLFYADTEKNVIHYTFPALLNFVICFSILIRDQNPKKLIGKTLWIITIGMSVCFNPFQGIILISMFCVQIFFSFLENSLENRKRKERWAIWETLKTCLEENLGKVLWILLWIGIILLKSSERVGDGDGLGSSLRLLKSSMLNMTPIFHESTKIINIIAISLALYRFIRKKETWFLKLQIETLFCMGITMVFLVLICAIAEERYLIRPDIMIVWMGWLLLMTMFSLAYIVKTYPVSASFLPFLVYMLLCEIFLHYTTFAGYTMADKVIRVMVET